MRSILRFRGVTEFFLLLSTSFALTAATAPTITNQPQSQTVIEGGSVSFSVAATGTPPFRYNWRKDGSSLDSATNSSFTIFPVKTTDSGSFAAVVSNDGGQATSAIATLTVISTNSAPNDLFFERNQFSGTSFSSAVSNFGATKELGEPNHAGNAGGKSVWWTWTAPIGG